MLQVAPNWCPTLLTLPTMLAGFTEKSYDVMDSVYVEGGGMLLFTIICSVVVVNVEPCCCSSEEKIVSTSVRN